MINVAINGANQIWHTGEYIPAQTLSRDVAKESLNHVQSGDRCWGEVDVEARIFLLSLPNLGMLMRGIVVTDQMQFLVPGCLCVDLAQEPQPLGVAVALLALGNDLSSSTLSAANSVVVPLRLKSSVMVAARPFFKSSPGCVRSSACT